MSTLDRQWRLLSVQMTSEQFLLSALSMFVFLQLSRRTLGQTHYLPNGPLTTSLKGEPADALFSKLELQNIRLFFETNLTRPSNNVKNCSSVKSTEKRWREGALKFASERHLPAPRDVCKKISFPIVPFRPLFRRNVISQRISNLILANRDIAKIWKGSRMYPDNVHTVRPQEAQVCKIQVTTLIKNNDRLYIAARLSDRRADQSQSRRTLLEFTTRHFTQPLELRHSNRSSRTCLQNRSCKTYTTLLTEGARPGFYSLMMNMTENEVPGFKEAENQFKEQISAVSTLSEELSLSNSAILALPIFLCFIPIAAMSDVSNLATIVYSLVTDFFSAVPLIIKGFELASKQGAFYAHAREVRILGDSGAQYAEVWNTLCQTYSTSRTGFTLVAIGFWAMVIGFITEFITWKFYNLRRKKMRSLLQFQDRMYIRTLISEEISALRGDPYPEFRTGDIRTEIQSLHQASHRNHLTSCSYRNRGLLPQEYEDNIEVPDFRRVDQQYLRSTKAWGCAKFFFLGIILGALLPLVSILYKYCISGLQTCRRLHLWFFCGCVLGSSVSFPMWILLFYLGVIRSTGRL